MAAQARTVEVGERGGVCACVWVWVFVRVFRVFVAESSGGPFKASFLGNAGSTGHCRTSLQSRTTTAGAVIRT